MKASRLFRTPVRVNMRPLSHFWLLSALASDVVRSTPVELELTEKDIQAFPSLTFADAHKKGDFSQRPRCKNFPSETSWPSESEWSRLNASLQGRLLKPLPPASVCYPTSPNFNTASCNFLFTNASQSTYFFDDPVTVLAEWPQGLTCPLSRNPTGNCTQGGFPVYVVNATTPKHVQAAVNFARNKNIRLIIKYESLKFHQGVSSPADRHIIGTAGMTHLAATSERGHSAFLHIF